MTRFDLKNGFPSYNSLKIFVKTKLILMVSKPTEVVKDFQMILWKRKTKILFI